LPITILLAAFWTLKAFYNKAWVAPPWGLHPVVESTLKNPPETTAAVAVSKPGEATSPQGEKTRNATNEAKLADNAIIAEVNAADDVMAYSGPNAELDKRAIEANERGSSPDLEGRVLNHRTEEANPESEPSDIHTNQTRRVNDYDGVDRVPAEPSGSWARPRALGLLWLQERPGRRCDLSNTSVMHVETFDFQKRTPFRTGDPMQTLIQVPVLFVAAQYALLYLLLGGGVFGAAGVYVVAKALNK
jgi:hypothetical protein